MVFGQSTQSAIQSLLTDSIAMSSNTESYSEPVCATMHTTVSYANN